MSEMGLGRVYGGALSLATISTGVPWANRAIVVAAEAAR
jgi:hypothetical protein